MVLNPFKKKKPAGIEPSGPAQPEPKPDDATDPLVPSMRWHEEITEIAAGALFKLERVQVNSDPGTPFSFLRLIQTAQTDLAPRVREALLQMPEQLTGFNDLLMLEDAPLAASLALPESCLAEYAPAATPEQTLLRPLDLIQGLCDMALVLDQLHQLCGLTWVHPEAAGVGLSRVMPGPPVGLARWQAIFTGWAGLEPGVARPAQELLRVFAPAWQWLEDRADQLDFGLLREQLRAIQRWLKDLEQDPALDYPGLRAALERMQTGLTFAAQTDPGRKRDHNEDAYLLLSLDQRSMYGAHLALAAVADGMGGHQSGEIASSLALDLLRQQLAVGLLPPRSSLADPGQLAPQLASVIPLIGRLLTERAELEPALGGMGTTLCGLAALRVQSTIQVGNEQWHAAIFNVGDSRAYLVTPAGLFPLTTDHSYVQDLVDQGELTAEQAFDHKMKNVITRCLGGNGSDATPDVLLFEPGPAEMILICSDGLSDALRDYEIKQTVAASEGESLAAVLNRLIREANAAGGPDNITVILVGCAPELD